MCDIATETRTLGISVALAFDDFASDATFGDTNKSSSILTSSNKLAARFFMVVGVPLELSVEVLDLCIEIHKEQLYTISGR